MEKEVVLVTGAAGGTQGQTGRHVSEMLLARGTAVRAFVRRRDERSERLRTLGADVVEGDFHDYPSVARALQGVRPSISRIPSRRDCSRRPPSWPTRRAGRASHASSTW